jgi:hypothetical protein
MRRAGDLSPWCWALVGSSWLALSCGDGPAGPVVASEDPRRNVLVIDEGIDPSAAVFKGKLLDLYTIACQEPPPEDARAPADGGSPDAGNGDVDGGADGSGDLDFARAKADLIANYHTKNERCHLRPGIEPKADPLAAIASLRGRWNRAVQDDRWLDSEFDERELATIDSAWRSGLEGPRYHGTATAGIIASSNPLVRLVLIEEQLGDLEEYMQSFTCFVQSEVDRTVQLLVDREVREAFAEQPLSSIATELRELEERHQIGLVNESFGYVPRRFLEDLQRAKGCPPIDLELYFEVYGLLTKEWAEAHPQPSPLVVQAAGNEMTSINGPADTWDCAASANPRIMVGAYALTGNRARFSNFGSCVDAFAPGEQVVGPAPGEWLLPLAGTSFASPLLVRLISLEVGRPFNAASERTAILAALDLVGRVPIQRFPPQLLYDPNRDTRSWPIFQTATPRMSKRMMTSFLAPLQIARHPGSVANREDPR